MTYLLFGQNNLIKRQPQKPVSEDPPKHSVEL